MNCRGNFSRASAIILAALLVVEVGVSGEAEDIMGRLNTTEKLLDDKEILSLKAKLSKGLPDADPQSIYDYFRYGGDVEFLELIWWRSRDATQRTLIVGLLGSVGEPGAAISPDFSRYLGHFSKDEASKRRSEIEAAKALSLLLRAENEEGVR
jgi:hypothetical protein